MNIKSTPIPLDLEFEFVCRNQADGDEKLREMMKDIDRMQAFIDSILEQCAKIDSSIAQFRDCVESVSHGMAGLGEVVYDVSAKKNSLKGAGIGLGLGLLSLGVQAIGDSIAEKREAKAAAERKRQMDAALAEKKRVAEAKVDDVMKNLHELKATLDRIAPEYRKLAAMSATESDASYKVSYFAKVFIMYARAKAGVKALLYVGAEMVAWLKGKHDSDEDPVTFADVLRDEMMSWTGGKTWGEWLKSLYESQEPTLPVPAVWIATEPAMFANAIGCRNYLLGFTEDSFLTPFESEGDSFMWRLTKKNTYYNTLKNMQQRYVYRKRPWYVNGIDILTILAPAALVLWGTSWACGMERGFFKVLCLILVFAVMAVAGIGIMLMEDDLYLTPRRWGRYYNECGEIEKDTKEKLEKIEAKASNYQGGKNIIYY